MSWSELIIGIKNVISVNVSRHSRIADVLILNVLFYLDLLSSIAFSVYIIHTKAISCDINPTTLNAHADEWGGICFNRKELYWSKRGEFLDLRVRVPTHRYYSLQPLLLFISFLAIRNLIVGTLRSFVKTREAEKRIDELMQAALNMLDKEDNGVEINSIKDAANRIYGELDQKQRNFCQVQIDIIIRILLILLSASYWCIARIMLQIEDWFWLLKMLFIGLQNDALYNEIGILSSEAFCDHVDYGDSLGEHKIVTTLTCFLNRMYGLRLLIFWSGCSILLTALISTVDLLAILISLTNYQNAVKSMIKNSGLNIEIGNSMAFGNFLGPRGQYWLRSVLSNANYRIAPAIVRQLFEMWHQNGMEHGKALGNKPDSNNCVVTCGDYKEVNTNQKSRCLSGFYRLVSIVIKMGLIVGLILFCAYILWALGFMKDIFSIPNQNATHYEDVILTNPDIQLKPTPVAITHPDELLQSFNGSIESNSSKSMIYPDKLLQSLNVSIFSDKI